MKKNIYKLNNIDCAACALNIEEAVGKINGVYSCSLNFIISKLIVNFDETIIGDEEIELCIHKSLRGVQIVEKNGNKFVDTYKEESIFKKILFKRK